MPKARTRRRTTRGTSFKSTKARKARPARIVGVLKAASKIEVVPRPENGQETVEKAQPIWADPAHFEHPALAPQVSPGSPRWTAYEDLVQKIESSLGATLDDVHRRLDAEGWQGSRFTEILIRVRNVYGVPEFYAGIVVRSYPGYSTEDSEAIGLRQYLIERRRN